MTLDCNDRAVATQYKCLERLALGRCLHVLSGPAHSNGSLSGAAATTSRALTATSSRTNGRTAGGAPNSRGAAAPGADAFAAPDERFVRALVAADVDVHALLWCEHEIGLAATVGIGRTYSGAPAARAHSPHAWALIFLCIWTIVARER